MIRQVPISPETISILQKLLLAPNEGVMYVKFVLLKQDTLTAGDALSKIDAAPAAIMLGDLDEMRETLATWMKEAATKYKGE